MSTLNPLEQLRRLDESSPAFSNQICDVFTGKGYRRWVVNLRANKLAEFVDHLDRVIDTLSPTSSAFRMCLRELGNICGARAILPTSYALSSHKMALGPHPVAFESSGDVFQGELDGIGVRVKRLKIWKPQKAKKAFYQGAIVWKHLKHKNIIPLLCVIAKPLQFISEWSHCGNLTDYIRKYPNENRLGLLSGIAEGLSFLHSYNVVHGDLKGSNILVDQSGHARIKDFGLATVAQDLGSAQNTPSDSSDAVRWTAPEILCEMRPYSKQADVFSFAMVVVEAFTGVIPFDGDIPSVVALMIICGARPPRPSHPTFTNKLWELMQHCWAQDPRSRPEVSEISRFLSDIDSAPRISASPTPTHGGVALIPGSPGTAVQRSSRSPIVGRNPPRANLLKVPPQDQLARYGTNLLAGETASCPELVGVGTGDCSGRPEQREPSTTNDCVPGNASPHEPTSGTNSRAQPQTNVGYALFTENPAPSVLPMRLNFGGPSSSSRSHLPAASETLNALNGPSTDLGEVNNRNFAGVPPLPGIYSGETMTSQVYRSQRGISETDLLDVDEGSPHLSEVMNMDDITLERRSPKWDPTGTNPDQTKNTSQYNSTTGIKDLSEPLNDPRDFLPTQFSHNSDSSLFFLSLEPSIEVPSTLPTPNVMDPHGSTSSHSSLQRELVRIDAEHKRYMDQRLIDGLDAALDQMTCDRDRSKLLNKLCKMCSRHRMIPKSMHMEKHLTGELVEVDRGGYATIFRARYQGRPVAVKTRRICMNSDFPKCHREFCREAVAWRHLRHPNIIPLLGVDLEEHRLSMISEWMDLGNINDFVKRYRNVNRVQLLVDAANGLKYMHNINVVHGDLKGANILITQGFRACLADFGLSTIIGMDPRVRTNASSVSLVSGTSLMSFTVGGTPRWMSPELLDPERFGADSDRPTKQSDSYALGMVVYEVLSGNAPYWSIANQMAVIYAITEGYRPKKPDAAKSLGFTDELWKTVQQCWLADPSARPDVKTVFSRLNHATWSWERRQIV